MQRPLPFSFPACLLLPQLVAKPGYSTLSNLRELQTSFVTALSHWAAKFVRRQPSARESRTAIGRIGRIKLSGRVVWRLETVRNQAPPSLLREASFDEYRYNSERRIATWLSNVRDDEYKGLTIETNDAWTLQPDAIARQTITLSGYAAKGKTLLPLPPGPVQVRHLAAETLDFSRLGVVRVGEASSLIVSPIDFGANEQLDAPPGVVDLKVPEGERSPLDRVVEELGIRDQPLEVALERIAHFFSSQFTYSTFIENGQRDETGERSPLGIFLEKTKSGHCEYFATATVLLLREAGLPARYGTG